MYRQVDGIPTLIGDLYHFLITIALGHTHKTTEFANAMVDMHYIVAYLKLADLLKGKSHFAASRLFGAEVILVETVEYLVVGEEACFQHVINKTLVQGLVNRDKVFQYLLQSFLLFPAVGQDIHLISHQLIILKRFLQ